MTDRPQVLFLPPDVTSRIAAGEVIERPASVVKELVENAIDARADSIDITVAGGGIEFIQVTDNGNGISDADIEIAFGRHATSKIRTFEDMQCLDSLGFRGEALPSIAAVSDVEITSGTCEEDLGSSLKILGGAVESHQRISRQKGTSIGVRRLFARVPARLKFLKTPAAESAKIARIVAQYALAYPEIKFVLIVDGKTLLRTTGSGHLVDTISQVYGLETAGMMLDTISADYDKTSLPRLEGMVSAPELNRSSSDRISIFVNRRWVNMRSINWAVEQAYHGLLMTGRHPLAVLNLTLDPADLDVNIHPGKYEVKFRDEPGIFTLIQKAVRATITHSVPVPQISERPVKPYIAGTLLPLVPQPPAHIVRAESTSDKQRKRATPHEALPVLRVIGQYRSGYIVCEGPDGLYIIDQHAAHERVRFEQLCKSHEVHEVAIQPLLEPVLIEISPEQSALVQTHIATLNEVGFTLEPFGTGTWLVRTIPSILAGKDWRQVITDVIGTGTVAGNDFLYSLLSSAACHSAVRFGKILDIEEMRELIKSLEQVTIPYSCPHGRPLMINLTEERLLKEFQRG